MQPKSDELESYKQSGRQLDRNQFASEGESNCNNRAGDAQNTVLFTTRGPLPNSRYRAKETSRAPEPTPEPIRYDEIFSAEPFSNNNKASYGSQRRPEQPARKPVQLFVMVPDYSVRLPGPYPERPAQAQNTLNSYAFAAYRPDPEENIRLASDRRPAFASDTESTRRPTQVIKYSTQYYEDSGKTSENTDSQSYDYSRLPQDRNHIAQNIPLRQNYQPQNYQSGRLPNDYQNEKPELSHIRDEWPLLTPDQKIPIVIDYPTANYNTSDCKFKYL